MFVLPFTYALTLWWIKFSILAFYNRLFSQSPLKRTLRIAAVLLGLSLLGCFLTQIFFCHPISGNFNPTVFATYWSPLAKHANILFCVLIVGTDAFLIFLPLPTVRKLRVSLKKKLSIGFLFTLGFFAIITSIVRTILFLHDATLFKVIVWSTVETVVCFLVANGPGLRPLFFRGADFETSSSTNVIPHKRGSVPKYDMNPQEKGVVTVVTANLERTNSPMGGQNCCADTVSFYGQLKSLWSQIVAPRVISWRL
jgi:hypothetical protein